MKSVPDIIDTDGNIQLHGRQGAVVSVYFQNDDGTPRDMTGKTVTFECGPDVNVNLTAGSTTDEMLLTLDQATVKAIFGQTNKNFVVLDYSQAQPTPIWIGSVYVTGWVE